MALDAILEAKRAELERSRRARSEANLATGLERAGRDFAAALARPHTGFILEHKRRSPSEGALRPDADLLQIVRAYELFADAISVLTDGPFFGGSLADLERVSQTVAVPVLRKDFILDPYQVLEARRAGADAVLLMLSVLDDAVWRDCAAAAREYGMGVLCEVHTDRELERAMHLGAGVIGINSRDLATLRVDLGVIDRLAPRVPHGCLVVAESGIASHADVRARRHLADAFLVGSTLMRAANLERATRELVFGAVKVCGLTRPKDAAQAYVSGATWGGLVFAPGSPRQVDMGRAAAVRRAAPLRWAGVFVDAPVADVEHAVRELALDAVQLHGDETRETVASVRRAVPASCEVWKAVRVRDAVPRLESTGADRMLLDAHDAQARGGTGKRFDWNLVARHPDAGRIVLAGGIRAENVADAAALGVSILDVSSGVEEYPGVKSAARLQQLFAAARGNGRSR